MFAWIYACGILLWCSEKETLPTARDVLPGPDRKRNIHTNKTSKMDGELKYAPRNYSDCSGIEERKIFPRSVRLEDIKNHPTDGYQQTPARIAPRERCGDSLSYDDKNHRRDRFNVLIVSAAVCWRVSGKEGWETPPTSRPLSTSVWRSHGRFKAVIIKTPPRLLQAFKWRFILFSSVDLSLNPSL